MATHAVGQGVRHSLSFSFEYQINQATGLKYTYVNLITAIRFRSDRFQRIVTVPALIVADAQFKLL